jgi:hypothetical protein
MPTVTPGGLRSLTVGHIHFFPSRRSALARRTTSGASTQPADSSENVTYHGGPVLKSPALYAIFWLPNGDHFEPAGVGYSAAWNSDGRYEALMMRYLQDVSNTPYYQILTQYYDTGGAIPPTTHFANYAIDTHAYPHAGTTGDPLLDSDLQHEVEAVRQAKGWPDGLGAVYFLFTAYGIQSCSDSSHFDCSGSSYCAYHSYYTDGANSPVIYANMPLAYSLGDCYVSSSPNDDYIAEPELSILAHEHFESVSDPEISAWYEDNSSSYEPYAEIGDLCAWTFGPQNPDRSDVVLNGDPYLLQQMWSNYGSTCGMAIPTATPTATGTATGTPTSTGTATATSTPTNTSTGTATSTATNTPTSNCTGDGYCITGLVASATQAQDGTDVTLTASLNQDIGPSSWYLNIADGNGNVVASCYTGTSCTATVNQSETTMTYTAYLDGSATGVSSSDPQSAPVSVTWTSYLSPSDTPTPGANACTGDGICITDLTASPNPALVGADVTLTASLNQDIQFSGWYLNIADSSGNVVATCSFGTTCTATVNQASPTSVTYIAYLDSNWGIISGSDPQSSPVSVTWTATGTDTPTDTPIPGQGHCTPDGDYCLTGLVASPNPAAAGTNVTLTANVKPDLGTHFNTIWYVNIADGNGNVVTSCSYGSTCVANVSQGTGAFSYTAYLDPNPYAVSSGDAQSNTVNVTWLPPTATDTDTATDTATNTATATVTLTPLPSNCNSVGVCMTSIKFEENPAVVSVGQTLYLDALLNESASASPFYFPVLKTSTGQIVSTPFCYGVSGGTDCLFTLTQSTPATVTYTAYLVQNPWNGIIPANAPYAGPVSGSWVYVYPTPSPTNTPVSANCTSDGYCITNLAASTTSIPAGNQVTLTASTNQNIGPSPWLLEIEDNNGNLVAACGTGTTCQATVSEPYGITVRYTAYLGGAQSSTVAVTWTGATPTPTTTNTPTATNTPTVTPTISPTGTTDTVTSCTESGLRSVLAGAGWGDTVRFACSGTITLTSAGGGVLALSKNLTLDGSGHTVTISGGGSVPDFEVDGGANVNLNDLTIANANGNFGDGIYNNKSVVNVSNSTITGNTGNAIQNDGTMTITNSTLSNNSGGDGGAIQNVGALTVVNSTFTGNSASYGGGAIAGVGGSASIVNSTFSGNSGPSGGNLWALYGSITLTNSILAGGGGGHDCSGTVTDGGGNLADDASCGFTQSSSKNSATSLNLGPLASNGGPTQTIALLTGSTAIDFATCLQPTDQRGFPRPDAGETKCDSGAYEYQDAPSGTVTPSSTATSAVTNTPLPTSTRTSTGTRTPSSTATNTSTSTATPSATRTSTPVPPTSTATSSATRTSTPLAPPSTATPTRTSTPVSPSSTPTLAPTNTPGGPTSTHTPKPTNTSTPGGPTSTITSTPSRTATSSATRTSTPLVLTSTATPTRTSTPVPPTSTSTLAPTNTPVGPTSTHTPKPTNTSTPGGPTSTITSTPTHTGTPSATHTSTPLPPTGTATLAPTNTPVPPTSTHTPRPTNTSTPGGPTSTITSTPSRTATASATRTSTPLVLTSTATPTRTSTPVPPTSTPTLAPTNTPVGPTSTHTPKPTNTSTPGGPTSTITSTPTHTGTPSATHTSTPLPPTGTATLAPTNTPVPPTSTHTPRPTNTSTPGGPTSTITMTPTSTATPSATRTSTHTPVASATRTATQTAITAPAAPAGSTGLLTGSSTLLHGGALNTTGALSWPRWGRGATFAQIPVALLDSPSGDRRTPAIRLQPEAIPLPGAMRLLGATLK